MATLIENVNKVVAAHAAIKAAVAAKGVDVPDGAKLTDIPALVAEIPIDTATPVPGISFYGGFVSGDVVLGSIVKCDFTQVMSVSNCFYSCSKITSLTLPDGFGSVATSVSSCFSGCISLTSLTLPDGFGSVATSVSNCFYNCSSLKTITGSIKFRKSFSLSYCPLTHDSLMNVINGLVTVTTSQTLTLGSTNKAKLSEEEIAIATAKGWTIA